MQVRTLLLLHPEFEAAPKPIQGFDRFIALAAEEGLHVKTVTIRGKAGGPHDEKFVLSQIESAQGFWVQHPGLLIDQRIRDAFEKRLSDGAVAFAELRWEEEPVGQYFQDLGLEATSIRAVRNLSVEKDGDLHPMLVRIRRSTFPSGFRDHTLFKGVHELLLQQANGIACFGDSLPILALPSIEIKLLDQRSDFYARGLTRPEFPVIAATDKSEWRGKIIAATASLVHDAFHSFTGAFFPGIEAADNGQFAKNVLRTISDGKSPPTLSWEYIFALICEIETSLARATAVVLASVAAEAWFDQLVPESIREKCLARRESERANFPIQAYLDLIDFKTIWRKHWVNFAPLLEACSYQHSKSEFSSRIQRLNEIRKNAMHAARREYALLPLPPRDSFAELEQLRDTMNALARAATGLPRCP